MSVCGVPNPDGYPVTCENPDRLHRGPHSAHGGGPGIVGIAWCTPPQPCRKGPCPGPCHLLDPR